MKSVFYFVFVYCFFALKYGTSDGVVCYTHDDYNGAPGSITSQSNCKHCGFQGYTSCNTTLLTNRSCLTSPLLYYYDSNGLPQNFTIIDEYCYLSSHNGCMEKMMICNNDYCNLDCFPKHISTISSLSPSTTITPSSSSFATSSSSSVSSSTAISSSSASSSSSTTTTPPLSSSSFATSTPPCSSAPVIQFSVVLIACLVAIKILLYA